VKLLLMYPPSKGHRASLVEAGQGLVELLVAGSEEEAKRLIRDADIVFGNRYFLQSLPFATRLRWMQSNSVGLDLILTAREQLRNIIVTSSRGVYDAEMADHALALILAVTRRLHLFRDKQAKAIWERESLPYLSGRHALILGWGGVGQAIAARLRVFNVDVRAARKSHSGQPAKDENGVLIGGPNFWRNWLPDADMLVLALPLTPDTKGLVGMAELQKLPRTAIVINVGRGETLNQRDLLCLLENGSLAGAGLDVFESEPPGEDDPVWHAPHLLVTPHVARSSEDQPPRWESLFVENLRRFVTGQALKNIVDLDRGY
jgi:phosphoglycerate dehydrogenase-like enzyme